MKKIFIAFIAAACMLSSCSDDSTDQTTAQSRISISGEGVISAGPDGAQKDITVTSSGDWRVAGTCDWARPSVVSGKNGEVVTFTVAPNDTDQVRETTFKFFTGSAVTELKVTSQPGYVLELLSESTLDFSDIGQLFDVKLHTNIDELTYTLSEGSDAWIHFDSRSDVFGAVMMHFSVDENQTYTGRSGVLTISGGDMEPIVVTVNQKQRDVILPEEMVYNFDLDGGKLTLNLQSNIAYTVEVPSKYASWIDYDAKTQTPPTELTSYTETFTIGAAEDLRAGKIVLKAVEGSYSVTLRVVQSGDTHVYATIPDSKFRTWLEDNQYAVIIEGSKCELTMAGQNATSFNCSSKGIASFEGITAFTKLTSLQCDSNPLVQLHLGDLNIETIDMSGTTNIGSFTISSTKLKKLVLYYCYNAQSVDVSACPMLDDLNVSACFFLGTLYIKAGQTFTNFQDKDAGAWVSGYKIVEK